MNIQTLNEYVNIFRAQICDSGFRRDLKDFTASLPNNEDNIISLREVANKIHAVLVKIQGGDLPEALQRMIPGVSPPPFTTRGYDTRLYTLIEDKNIEQVAFFKSLMSILTELADNVEANFEAVEEVRKFTAPYVKTQKSQLGADNKAVVSIIFRDLETITGLHSFSRTLAVWDRTLPLYHQLVTGTSPDAIQIVEVQNGSIDVVLNINADVAVNLAELFKYGLMAFSAYLAHKKLLLPISKAYFDNQKLKDHDEVKERMLLEHVGEVIAIQAKKQFDRSLGDTSKVDNPQKIIDSIRNLITAHIVRGNEYKILALPEQAPANASKETINAENEKKQLAEATAEARSALKDLPVGATTMLLDEYGSYREDSDSLQTQDHGKSKSKRTHSPSKTPE